MSKNAILKKPIFSLEPLWAFPRQLKWRIWSMVSSTLTYRTLLASSGGSRMRRPILPRVLQANSCCSCQEVNMGRTTKENSGCIWGLPVGGGSFPLNQFFSIRYLTPPATSTAVERLFSAAGLIMEAKRNRLCPEFVDKFLFLREAHLLGICKLDWQ